MGGEQLHDGQTIQNLVDDGWRSFLLEGFSLETYPASFQQNLQAHVGSTLVALV